MFPVVVNFPAVIEPKKRGGLTIWRRGLKVAAAACVAVLFGTVCALILGAGGGKVSAAAVVPETAAVISAPAENVATVENLEAAKDTTAANLAAHYNRANKAARVNLEAAPLAAFEPENMADTLQADTISAAAEIMTDTMSADTLTTAPAEIESAGENITEDAPEEYGEEYETEQPEESGNGAAAIIAALPLLAVRRPFSSWQTYIFGKSVKEAEIADIWADNSGQAEVMMNCKRGFLLFSVSPECELSLINYSLSGVDYHDDFLAPLNSEWDWEEFDDGRLYDKIHAAWTEYPNKHRFYNFYTEEYEN